MTNLSKKIAALKPREKRFSLVIEKGLTIRVHPSGKKSWVVRVPKNGRVIDLTLGHFPEISLVQAKQLARKHQKRLEVDPIAGYVLRDGFILWCNLKRGRITSYQDEKRRLERYVIQPLGKRPLDEITPPLIIKTVRHLENSGRQATLKRVLMRTREILDLCVYAGYITHNPLLKISKVFAPARVKSMPAIDWKDLPFAMQIIREAPERMRILFLFSLCTMLRPGEVAKLEKSWIQDNTIIIPANQMKKGRPHRVPITTFMAELLEKERRLSPHPRNKYLFAGRTSNSHISKQALAKWLHTSPLKGKLVAHGLRSVARCWLADNEIPFEISEACLSHLVGDRVYRAYQRSDFLEARRPVMERWCSHVLLCAASAGLLTDSPCVSRAIGNFSAQKALC